MEIVNLGRQSVSLFTLKVRRLTHQKLSNENRYKNKSQKRKFKKTLNQNKSIKSNDRGSCKIEYGQKILKTKLKV